MASRRVYQPLHPTMRPVLDPEYVAFHDKYVQYLEPDEAKVFHTAMRTTVSLPPSSAAPESVGRIEHYQPGRCDLRVFFPERALTAGTKSPVFLWFHGGGWTTGTSASNDDVCTRICNEAQCVTVSVGYRLAPENPYPAAVEDAIESLQWVVSEAGLNALGVDASRIALGGTSSGGGLAAVLSMKAALLPEPIKIAFQLLVVPVIDNTATVETVWKAAQYVPWLTPAKMVWYRKQYLPNVSDHANWDASPNLAPARMLVTSPDTWIAAAEYDLLHAEATYFAASLSKAFIDAGIDQERQVTCVTYPGMPHSVLTLNGILSQGRFLLNDIAHQAVLGFQRH